MRTPGQTRLRNRRVGVTFVERDVSLTPFEANPIITMTKVRARRPATIPGRETIKIGGEQDSTGRKRRKWHVEVHPSLNRWKAITGNYDYALAA
jgi:hypothetical protein